MLMNKRIIHKLAEYEKHLIHPSAGDGGGGVCVCVCGGGGVERVTQDYPQTNIIGHSKP